MIRSIVLFSGGIILFIVGVILYGILINLRENSLQEAMLEKGYRSLNEVSIVITRSKFTLDIYEDTVLIKSYRASFGRNLTKPKTHNGDGATPVGDYNVCRIDTIHKYYKFIKINYPNLIDITDALRKGVITQEEYDQLRFEYYYDECPKLQTRAGYDVGIHGIGRMNFILRNLPFIYNWTDGSIAVSNENIDELYSVIKKGTKVVIK